MCWFFFNKKFGSGETQVDQTDFVKELRGDHGEDMGDNLDGSARYIFVEVRLCTYTPLKSYHLGMIPHRRIHLCVKKPKSRIPQKILMRIFLKLTPCQCEPEVKKSGMTLLPMIQSSGWRCVRGGQMT